MITPEILKQVKAIELRTRGLVGTLFAGEYRSVFRGQGMEFAEVRAYEPGDDFRSIDWNVSARLGQPLREDVHRGARAHPHAAGGPVGIHPLRRAGHQGRAGRRGRRGAGARRGVPQRPRRSAALRRPGGAGDSAAQGTSARAARHPRSGGLRAGRPAHQPRRRAFPTPAACSAITASSSSSPISSPTGGSAPSAGSPRATRSWRSRWTTRASTGCPTPAGSRCSTPNRGGGCWWTPGSREVRNRVSALAAHRREERSRTLASVGCRRGAARDRSRLRASRCAARSPGGRSGSIGDDR